MAYIFDYITVAFYFLVALVKSVLHLNYIFHHRPPESIQSWKLYTKASTKITIATLAFFLVA